MNWKYPIILGNEALHQLTTTDVNSLYVSITLNNGSSFFELYETFSISSELDNYRLSVGGQASGTLGKVFWDNTNNNTNISVKHWLKEKNINFFLRNVGTLNLRMLCAKLTDEWTDERRTTDDQMIRWAY